MHVKSEKGFYGWVMVVLLFVVYFITGGFGQYGVAVTNQLMAKETGISMTSFGLAVSFFSLFQGFAAPLIAKSNNSKGVKFTIAWGSFGFAVVALLMATVVHQSVWAFTVVYGVLGGAMLSASSTVPVQASLNLWFKKRRSLAIAIVMLAAGVGGFVISPGVMAIISNTNHSYTAGWYTIMIGFLLAGVLTLIFGVNKPQDLGQVPDGKFADKEVKEKVSRVYKVDHPLAIKVIMKHSSVWLITLASCCFFFAHGIVNTCAVIFLSSGAGGSLNTAQATLAFGFIALMSIPGRILVGVLGDIMNPRHIWSFGILCLIAGILCLMTSRSYVTAVLFASLFGIGWGINMVSFPAVIGNYYGGSNYSSVMGYIFPIKQVVMAVAPIMTGVIFDTTKSYTAAFLIGVGVCVVSFVGLQFLRPIKPKPGTETPIAETQAV